MKCITCKKEYDKPVIINDTTYFTCSNCGNVHEVKKYHGYTKDQIIGKIQAAFSSVVLGDGIGLFEAQALDNYEPEDTQKKEREKDEKTNWRSINYSELQSCSSSLSFFDANGMRFHLPAFIIGSIKEELDDPIFYLTQIDSYKASKLATFDECQIRAVIEYLTWCLAEEEYQFDHECIVEALNEFWESQLTSASN
ncbi:MAG: hypothetical protein KUG78_18955 [Kangiellaceae bacterium]|nr:hypothetical protein [Kangiellaceae bacterium]